MNLHNFAPTDLWRSIILYGLNTATYKIALGQCLAQFVANDQSTVSIPELAAAFFDLYLNRLKTGKPQLSHPGRKTVMERIVTLHMLSKLGRDEAVAMVAREAFGDVVPRFHTLTGIDLPIRFYEHNPDGLILTDHAFHALDSEHYAALMGELTARWDLLEAAFEMKREPSILANDIWKLYLEKGYERKDVTGTRTVLNGYQNGMCFYCGERMADNAVHVDHVIPRQLLRHDDIWNLALAHDFCNQQKSDALPGDQYVMKLIDRNEALIASNHPIKNRLIQQLGGTPQQRQKFLEDVYGQAKQVIPYTWEGVRGYNPATDPFYKTFIRSITK